MNGPRLVRIKYDQANGGRFLVQPDNFLGEVNPSHHGPQVGRRSEVVWKLDAIDQAGVSTVSFWFPGIVAVANTGLKLTDSTGNPVPREVTILPTGELRVRVGDNTESGIYPYSILLRLRPDYTQITGRNLEQPGDQICQALSYPVIIIPEESVIIIPEESVIIIPEENATNRRSSTGGLPRWLKSD